MACGLGFGAAGAGETKTSPPMVHSTNGWVSPTEGQLLHRARNSQGCQRQPVEIELWPNTFLDSLILL